MANTKKITHLWSATGLTMYCIIRKDSNGYLLNDADGAFADAPADPYVSLTEHGTVKGLYELSESRVAWDNGAYTVAVYKQAGASPAPASDTVVGSGQIEIISDTEIVISAIKAETVLIVEDTGTTLPTTLATIAGYLDTEIASILEDTGTTLPASLAALDAKIDTIDTNVDAVLEDTGTTLPASIAGIAAAVWNYLISAMTTVGSIGAWFADWFDSVAEGATAFGASDLEVCNNALLLLGHDPLTDLTGTDKATKLVVQFYDQACKGTLRAYPWNCALVRSAALTVDATAPEFDYDYRFPLPAGCLRVLRMGDKSDIFKVEGDWLLTNESEAKILYISDIDADEMDQLLIDAISARLAATIAFPLTNSDRTAEAMWKLYLMKLDEAQNIDAFEGTADSMEADDWVNKRL